MFGQTLCKSAVHFEQAELFSHDLMLQDQGQNKVVFETVYARMKCFILFTDTVNTFMFSLILGVNLYTLVVAS